MAETELRPGDQVRVIKLHPLGHEVTRYPATMVLDRDSPAPWIAVEAKWTTKRVEVNGLVFEPGDTLIEYFSPDDWFNVFHVFAPDGTSRGWYANVTYPTRVETGPDGPEVIWHDLYLDLIKPSGQPAALCDEDELVESELAQTDPELYERILATLREMQIAATEGRFPFVDQTG